MLLNVEKVTPAKTGKSLRVKSGNDWYGAKKDSGITEGMTIEAEVEDGEYGKWIGKYRQVSKEAPAQTQKTATTSNGNAPVWANFVSNQVAHAIAAGRIDDPEQIKVWAAAAKQAFEELL